MPVFALPAIFGSILNFWNKLPPSIKVLLLLFLAVLGGFVWGKHETTKKYEAKIEQSIQEAKHIDKEANQTAFNNMEADKEKWRKQSLDMENKLSEHAAEYADMLDKCKSSEEFIKRNKEIDDLLTKKDLRRAK